MIADHSDIKFACSQCGQRIVVEKAAAGLAANCPICDGSLTVPLSEAHTEGGHPEHDFHSFRDPALHETQEALFDLSVDHGKKQRELDEANQEIERLRALFKKAVDECERITASATHAQAEIKSFHGDRQQLKTDLVQARQRSAAAENQVAELAASLAQANEALDSFQQEHEQDLVEIRESFAAHEQRLAERERDLLEAREQNSEVVQALAGAQAEVASLRSDWTGLRAELETAQQLLNEAAEREMQLETEKQELHTRIQVVTAESQQWREKADQLHRDLTGTDLGGEVIDLRSRLRDITEDRAHIAETLAEQRAETRHLESIEKTLKEELDISRKLHEEAERKAAANSELQLNKDNEVLRGIVARQNTTLGVYYSEVRRLRRERLALRLVYAFFALGVLGLVYFAINVFEQRGAGEFISRLLQ